MRERDPSRAGEEDRAGDIDYTVFAPARKRWDWITPFVSLRNRNFRLYIIGLLLATTALQMQTLAQNYLVYQLTDMATAIGYVSAAVGASLLITSLAGGVAADRLPKRTLMVVGQLGISVFALFIGVMVTTDLIQVWHIVVSSIGIGLIAGFTMPARQSYVPDLVGDENLVNALALSSGMMNVTRIGGPALAGVLIGMFGVGPLFYVKFVAYGIFVVFLLLIPVAGKAVMETSGSAFRDAIEGFRYLRRDRRVLDLLILGLVPMIIGMPYVNFLPVFQEEVFHVGPSELGIMMSAVGGGAVVGSLVVASLGDYQRKGYFLLGSGLSFAITLILFNVVASTGSFPLSLVMLALVGMTGTAFMALNNALVLSITLPEMRGRVMGVFMTTFGLMPLGTLPMGRLIDSVGAPLTVGSFAAAMLVFFIVMALFRPGIRNLKEGTAV